MDLAARPSPNSDLTASARGFDQGPALLAIPFRQPSRGKAQSLLSSNQRAALAEISAPMTLPKGAWLYRAGDAASFVYIITNGYVRTSRALANGAQRVTSFRSGGDLLGLAAEGRYAETAQALATTSAYRVPLDALEDLLRKDPSLGLRLLCKAASIVAAQQNHAMILGRPDALGKLAMFLELLHRLQRERGWETEMIYLPMSRSDIADYVGLSIEAVSRTLTTLRERRVVVFRTSRQLRVLDAAKLKELIAGRRRRPVAAKQQRATNPARAGEHI